MRILPAILFILGVTVFAIWFWYVAKIERDHKRATPATIDELYENLQNGDVIQFFSRLNSLKKFVWVPMAKFVTNSIYSHTAIVVEEEGKKWVYAFAKAPSKSRTPIWPENDQMCRAELRKFLELNMKWESFVMRVFRAPQKVKNANIREAAATMKDHRYWASRFSLNIGREGKMLHCGNFVGGILEALSALDPAEVPTPILEYRPYRLGKILVEKAGYSGPEIFEIRP